MSTKIVVFKKVKLKILKELDKQNPPAPIYCLIGSEHDYLQRLGGETILMVWHSIATQLSKFLLCFKEIEVWNHSHVLWIWYM